LLQELSPAEAGRRVRVVRRVAGMTQEQLAQEMGIESLRVSWIERGAPKTVDWNRLVRIARATAGKGGLTKTTAEVVLDFLASRRSDLPAQMS
jgi:transcriptional regulator with XRE-family HTH domain